jgi:hypothetical protein
MKAEKDKLTEVVKHKLADYEKQPPAHVWDNIHAQLNTVAPRENAGLTMMLRKHWYIAVALAAAILLLLFVLSFAGDAGIYDNNILKSQSKFTEKIKAQKTPDENSTAIAEVVKILIPKQKKKLVEEKVIHSVKENIQTPVKEQRKKIKPINTLLAFASGQITNKPLYSLPAKADFKEKNILKQLPVKDQDNQIIFTDMPAHMSGNNNWAFGIYATPEMMYGHSQNTGGNPSYSADFAIMYKLNDYFLQSGLSFGSSDDNSNANINYMQTEFMGTYHDVYDVTFDTTGGAAPQPVYHTQEVEVYDTTEHYTTTVYTNSYRYLSLPLLMGYQQQITDKFSYSLKGGPMVSFMLGESSDFAFNHENAHIQAIYNMPADRVTTNWQALISLGLQYRIHKQIHFAVEPRMKYYFNPVYNTQAKGRDDNPVALGVRTGLIVGF